MTSTLIADSISTTLSDGEDYMNDIEDTGIIWSQEDSLTTCNVIEPETKSTSKYDDETLARCRLCAGQANNPIYIYSEFGESMKLAEKINTCLSIKVRRTDPLPKQLCHMCVEKLNWCDSFDVDCTKAEETLETMLREEMSCEAETTDLTIPEVSCNDATTCCPLCVEGQMRASRPSDSLSLTTQQRDLYEGEIVMESDEEEKILSFVGSTKGDAENSTNGRCTGNQQYIKCGACMNLYHTRESLDSHKCKPSIQTTTKPYKCLICEATYPFEELLNFHGKFHRGERELYCDICKINFSKELKLYYHYKRYHCEDRSVSCLQCGKLFHDQGELRCHICTDGKTRPHVCEICNKGFTDGYTLKRHVVTHLPEKPYKCTQCTKSFTQKSRLNKHIAAHGVVIENTQSAWLCRRCGEIFDDNKYAEEHKIARHTDDPTAKIDEVETTKIYHCEYCNSHYNDLEILREHQNLHVIEKPYTCNVCDSVYKSYAEAVLHWKEHPRVFRVAVVYTCDICGKDMKDMSLLYKHRRKRDHASSRRSENTENPRRYACELCARCFDSVDDLRVHGRDQCTKFPCDICGGLLPTANSLHAHMRQHSGLRPYVCNICGKSYTQSSHMWTHKRFHMGVKPYACEYCDQRFTIKPDLADHTRKKHTRERPFKCDVCNKAFLTGSVFYQHRLIHRGDRRYKCHYCEKAFTRTEALNNHIKIHTGEKPHACDVCGRCFRQKGDMRKHRRTQHNANREENA